MEKTDWNLLSDNPYVLCKVSDLVCKMREMRNTTKNMGSGSDKC